MPTKDVNKLLKGVSDCILAAVDDAGAESPAQVSDSFPLLSLGYLDENSIQSESKKLTQKEHGGNLLQLGEIATVNINSLSGAGTSITAARKFKNAQCNIYGFGSQQSHKLTRFLMNIETPNDMKQGGKSVIQFSTEKKVSPDETLGTLGSSATAFSADAAYRFKEYIRGVRQENLVFSIIPYLGNFGQTTKLYDASDNRISGSLFNGPTWGTAPDGVNAKVVFDGVNDYASFGDVLDDDGVSDLLIEMWVRVTASNGTKAIFMAKKPGVLSSSLGFGICRDSTDNLVKFDIADGTNRATASSASTLLQNIWKHVAISIDRNGNIVIYMNGVAGTGVSCATVASVTNASNMTLARDSNGTEFGAVEYGAFRVYNFGAGNIPANISTIIADHYNAEKAIFGL